MDLVYRPLVSYAATRPRSYLSREQACSAFFEGSTSQTELTDRRIGLNMNNSNIFTEISFFPETSILLQIIRIIHMTIWIIPNLGGQSVGSGSKVVHTMRLPQTRELLQTRAPPGGPSGAPPPPLKGRSDGLTRLPESS